ncbi:MAG: C40 family peptidase [Bacteroidales bacterium]|nr:C40 family peptidase [Bacteroidales bacterium]
MEMNTGICGLSLVAVREKPSHKSEMINQLLFGDVFLILNRFDTWLLIESADDHYQGWVEENQVELIDKSDFESIQSEEAVYTEHLCCRVRIGETNQWLSAGSRLPHYHKDHFKIGEKVGTLAKECAVITGIRDTTSLIISAKKYLGTPYLWGGRSSSGLDCSGFTQIVFKMNGYQLPRDSSQQAKVGDNIDFIHEALPGDLVFFENEEQQIAHVGILMKENQIIHASGQVRIDPIDHEGIFNKEKKKYTHKLRLIKRILSEEN